MKNIYILCFLLFFVLSCKSTKILDPTGATTKKTSLRTVIKNHDKNTVAFNTLRARLKVSATIQQDKQQDFTLSLRMQKDKAIWLSATLSMVRVYITPDKVRFYNKLNNTFFEGDFTYLTNLLGTTLDFQKLQRLLLAESIYDLNKEDYTMTSSQGNYQLQTTNTKAFLQRLLWIDPLYFKVKKQQVTDLKSEQTFSISYINYQKVKDKTLPNTLSVVAKYPDPKQNKVLDIEYKNIQLGAALKFPYRVPQGYTQIILE